MNYTNSTLTEPEFQTRNSKPHFNSYMTSTGLNMQPVLLILRGLGLKPRNARSEKKTNEQMD